MRFIGKFAASNSNMQIRTGAVRTFYIVSQSFLAAAVPNFQLAIIHHYQILLHGIRPRPHQKDVQRNACQS